jgi:hypothetical protein
MPPGLDRSKNRSIIYENMPEYLVLQNGDGWRDPKFPSLVEDPAL